MMKTVQFLQGNVVLVFYPSFWGLLVFGANRFGSILYLISTYFNIIKMDHPSSSKKCINFRYEIQYTNELIGNADFMPKKSISQQNPSTQNREIVCKEEEAESPGRETPRSNKKRTIKERDTASGIKNVHSIDHYSCIKMEQVLGNLKLQEKKVEKMEGRVSTSKRGRGRGLAIKSALPSRERMDEQEEEIKNPLSRKGLALISSLILQVLEGQYKENKKFTCGEISAKVLTEFCNKSQQKLTESTIDEKERKTIKRRVYDSINVLIALGKIKKDHKFLYVQSIDRKIGEEIIEAKKEKLQAINREYQKKVEMLKRAKLQYQRLKTLKQRNEQLSQSKEQGFSGTFSTFSHKGTSHVFKFPLLMVYTEKHSRIQISLERTDPTPNQPAKQISTIEADPLYILSDLASLEYLSFKHDQSRYQPVRKQLASK